MTDEDSAQMLNELDRLLNDPAVPIQPAHIWRLRIIDARCGHARNAASRMPLPIGSPSLRAFAESGVSASPVRFRSAACRIVLTYIL